MTKKAVQITPEENMQVENLFAKYNSYMSMLEYFANSGLGESKTYSQKWDETSQIWIELDKAKRAVEVKYKPQGDWDSYEFDFDNQQVVFIKA